MTFLNCGELTEFSVFFYAFKVVNFSFQLLGNPLKKSLVTDFVFSIRFPSAADVRNTEEVRRFSMASLRVFLTGEFRTSNYS